MTSESLKLYRKLFDKYAFIEEQIDDCYDGYEPFSIRPGLEGVYKALVHARYAIVQELSIAAMP